MPVADQEQENILKQGTDVWNYWRKEHPTTAIDLRNSDLVGRDLRGANLSKADLGKADLRWANLNKTDLSEAYLREADFFGADLDEANLSKAQLILANLSRANLRKADLSKSDLSGAILSNTSFIGSNLSEANFSGAEIRNIALGDVDLSKTLGLEIVNNYYSSTLGTNTISLSKGKIPEVFLRGCGLSDWEIEAAKLYDPNLSNQDMDDILYKVHDIRANQPVQISPLFISYSHADSEFVNKLENHLNDKGVRFWRDVHNATAGKLEKVIGRAIRHNPTVVLILSKDSIKSDWVEHEVRMARELEKEVERDVLCPVALDDSWKISPWPKRVMEQVKEYNILDFSKWNDDENFKNTFVKLMDGLNLYYKK